MEKRDKFKLLLSMVIFGTVGIFRKYIPLSSELISLARGFTGTLIILIFMLSKGNKISFKNVKNNFLLLVLSGILIGFNWILLFESYNYTTVATATLCYYMAPVIVIVASPFLFNEKLTKMKILCVLCAVFGMIAISGILEGSHLKTSETKGILLSLGAAVLYGSVIIINKKIKGISALDKTVLQLASATVILIPYNLLTQDFTHISFTFSSVILLVIVGIVHTGIAYCLYFSSIGNLKAQTTALFSYIDPLVAIILSSVIFNEKMSPLEILGGILILGSTVVCELKENE